MRREEVAARAFISTEYYTRIEQGRFVPSPDVLVVIARVLNLSHDERQYVLDLVHVDHPLPVRPPSGQHCGERLDPGLAEFINGLGSTPALIVGPFTKLLAWNPAATELFLDFSRIDPAERTCAHLIFMHDTFRNRFADVDEMERTIVAILRAGLAATPADRREGYVNDLSRRSEAFARRWGEQEVRQSHDTTPTMLNHPRLGRLRVDRGVLRNVDTPEVRLLFFPPR